jgi:hypothetical protein
MEHGDTATPSSARWDRNRVLFEVESGGQMIECAISREALQDLSDRRYAKPEELMACFDKVGPRIARVALAKARERSAAEDGLIFIWSDDLEDAPED